MKKTRYIPGELIRELTERIGPSESSEFAVECGLYNGDYKVVHSPRTRLRPEHEVVRVAAARVWRDQLVDFNEIISWIRDGAVDPQTNKGTYQASPGEEKAAAVLLINSGLFKHVW